jgi:hypothetical protein
MTIFHRTHRDDPAAKAETERRADREEPAHDAFGGINWGSAFFGWLIAVAMTVLLGGIVGAAASAVGMSADLTLDEAEVQARTIGLAGAIALTIVLLVGYYAGGYVAGRMSRFDGARQGMAVWILGLVVTLIAGVAGWLLGEQYNVLERVDLPNLPLPQDVAAVGGLITAAAILAVTLIGAVAGGKLGQRYHTKVDRARHF